MKIVKTTLEPNGSLSVIELLECGHELETKLETMERRTQVVLKRNCKHCCHNLKVVENYPFKKFKLF